MTWLEIALTCVVAAGVAYVVGSWLFKMDEKAEDTKRMMIKLSGALRGVGLQKIPELLEDVVVGDWSKIIHNVKELVQLFTSNEEAVLVEFGKVFDNLLAAKLKTETGRAYIAAKLEDATKETDVSVVKDAVKATVV